jgi:hypothetical protein
VFLSFVLLGVPHRTSENFKIISVIHVHITAMFKLDLTTKIRFKIEFPFQRTYFCGVIIRSQGVVIQTSLEASILRSSKRLKTGAVWPTFSGFVAGTILLGQAGGRAGGRRAL